MEFRFIAALLLAPLLLSMASAASVPTADMAPLLDSALKDAQCRVTFETGFMNAIIDEFPSMSSLLSPRIGDMQSDESQLGRYAGQGDAKNFSRYVQETFSKHLKQDVDAVQAGIEGLKNESGGPPDGDGGPDGGGGGSNGGPGGSGNGTGGPGDGSGGPDGGGGGSKNGTDGSKDGGGGSMDEFKASMESLQSTYKSLRDDMDGCVDMKAHANLVLDYYDTELNSYQSRAQNLTARGINASNLLELVEGARAKIVTPLQGKIAKSDNASEIRGALFHYCLYDGCANGTNFHMAAKFETMRMNDLLAAMSPKAADAGLSGNVSAAQASLDAARREIDSWGDNDASPDQLKAVWTNIKSAAKGNHDIFIALNGSAGAD